MKMSSHYLVIFSIFLTAKLYAWDPSSYKKIPNNELNKKLSAIQYKVTQEEETEAPFKNDYFDNHQEGIYIDIVSGEPLFSSIDKYDSGTGWPSFKKPLAPENIVTKIDKKLFSKRIEVRSKYGNSHLGHVFDDGPYPTGKRYCINSASLKFISKEKLRENGYENFEKLFSTKINGGVTGKPNN